MSNFMIPFMIVFVWQSATKTSQPNKSNLIQFMVMVMYAFLLLLWGLWLLRNNKLYNKHRLRDTLNVKYLGKFMYYMVGFTTKEIILVKIVWLCYMYHNCIKYMYYNYLYFKAYFLKTILESRSLIIAMMITPKMKHGIIGDLIFLIAVEQQ